LKQPPKECVKEVIEVYGNLEGVSKDFQGVLGKFHGCHREISRVFQECFTEDLRLLNQFQWEFQEGFKDLSSKFQGSFIDVSRIFHRKFKDLS